MNKPAEIFTYEGARPEVNENDHSFVVLNNPKIERKIEEKNEARATTCLTVPSALATAEDKSIIALLSRNQEYVRRNLGVLEIILFEIIFESIPIPQRNCINKHKIDSYCR